MRERQYLLTGFVLLADPGAALVIDQARRLCIAAALSSVACVDRAEAAIVVVLARALIRNAVAPVVDRIA
jgi:hypothetical protein